MIRERLRSVKAKVLRFEKVAPAVLVFGLRRGGSTMVTDAISANRGVWFADEPYAMFKQRRGYTEKSARLHSPKHSHFFGLSNAEQERFAAFSHDLLDAQFRTMGTARRTKSLMRADRTCLKVLNAPWMLQWFAQETDAHIIAVTRHPGAQARSVLRQGWQFPVEAYLDRPDVLTPAFTPDQIAQAQDIFARADPWQVAVLDWVITSHPLRHADGPRVIRTSYEQIVTDPSRFVGAVLISKCGLTRREAMGQAILRPSGSSHLNTAAATRSIASRNLEKMLNGWRAHTTDEELSSGQAILDSFEVDAYRFID
jgi:hypothetical protein